MEVTGSMNEGVLHTMSGVSNANALLALATLGDAHNEQFNGMMSDTLELLYIVTCCE